MTPMMARNEWSEQMSAWLMRSSDNKVLIHTQYQLEMINKEEEIQSQKPNDLDQSHRGQHHRDQEEQNLRRQRMNQ